jgi:hypothetical protein
LRNYNEIKPMSNLQNGPGFVGSIDIYGVMML